MALATARANAALEEALTGATHVQLHTGNPGAAGTSNVYPSLSRQAVTFDAAAGGEKAITNEPEWDILNNGTVTYVSVWTASSGGTFIGFAQISPGRAVVVGDRFILRSLTFIIATP